MKKMISWLLAAGMLLGSSLMLASCREPEPDPGENKEPDRTVYQIYENFDLFVRADSVTHPIDFDHVSGGLEDYELLVPIVIPADEKLVTVRRGADVTVIAEIEHAGATEGAAQISEQHGNFIVNLGGAKASDVIALIRRAHDAVLERYGIDLACEVKLLGF